MTLHILSASPWSGAAFARCLRALAPGDALLLCGEAVRALRAGTAAAAALADLPHDLKLHALAPDCALRGVDSVLPGVNAVDYAGFVALACEAPRSVSWF